MSDETGAGNNQKQSDPSIKKDSSSAFTGEELDILADLIGSEMDQDEEDTGSFQAVKDEDTGEFKPVSD